jgi:hypothetical protein
LTGRGVEHEDIVECANKLRQVSLLITDQNRKVMSSTNNTRPKMARSRDRIGRVCRFDDDRFVVRGAKRRPSKTRSAAQAGATCFRRAAYWPSAWHWSAVPGSLRTSDLPGRSRARAINVEQQLQGNIQLTGGHLRRPCYRIAQAHGLGTVAARDKTLIEKGRPREVAAMWFREASGLWSKAMGGTTSSDVRPRRSASSIPHASQGQSGDTMPAQTDLNTASVALLDSFQICQIPWSETQVR